MTETETTPVETQTTQETTETPVVKEKKEKTVVKIAVFNNHGTVHFHCDKLEIPQMNTEAVQTQTPEQTQQPQQTPSPAVQPVPEEPTFKVIIPSDDISPEERVKTKLNLQQKHLDKFKQWTQKKEFRLLYENDSDQFYARDLFPKVKGVENCMLLIETTSNMLFGAFYPIMPTKQNTELPYHSKHFVFTIRNPFVIPPTMIRPRVQNNSLLHIKGDEDNFNILESHAFIIKNDTTSKINIRFSSSYQDDTKKGETLFTGREKVFQVKNLIAIQWY